MKRVFSVCQMMLVVFLFGLLSFLNGCGPYSQPGETEAEGRRRHERVTKINKEELMSDIDRAGLLDRPSRATDRRVP